MHHHPFNLRAAAAAAEASASSSSPPLPLPLRPATARPLGVRFDIIRRPLIRR